ncbi:endonuclease [Thauera aminoaromatica]|uniref:Endonuclease n=1 Tax=Thauera aminoaromatica TaxID=164330 RepID=A0A5C7T717_THASP|nr:endonuclease [Thauera aminoaromatica]TXH91649.1 MAG: endonuclease [Thauera aminoaromatica]
MRYSTLLFGLVLAGCNAAYVPDRPVRPLTAPAPAATSGSASFDLVTGKTATGHRDFANAKKVLPVVYLAMERDFYCGCRYAGTTVDFASCGYVPRKNLTRASRIEWEHVVPAWVLGHQRQCWQAGGRENCADNDPVFQVAEGDLNNLVPAVGEINGDRSNYAYSAWTKTPEPMYGRCETVVDFKLKKAQPREAVRGRAARITLYMAQTYGVRLSDQDRKLMCAWARTYPVDDWERERNLRILRWQGRGNPFVTDATQLKRACG